MLQPALQLSILSDLILEDSPRTCMVQKREERGTPGPLILPPPPPTASSGTGPNGAPRPPPVHGGWVVVRGLDYCM